MLQYHQWMNNSFEWYQKKWHAHAVDDQIRLIRCLICFINMHKQLHVVLTCDTKLLVFGFGQYRRWHGYKLTKHYSYGTCKTVKAVQLWEYNRLLTWFWHLLSSSNVSYILTWHQQQLTLPTLPQTSRCFLPTLSTLS